MNPAELNLVSASGMLLVGALALVGWRLATHLAWRWFWGGAGLWTVAVAVKVAVALATNGPVIQWLERSFDRTSVVALGALYIGVQSSLTEIGFTLLAVLVWPQLGRGTERAIGIGLGAGAFEAILLGLGALTATIALLAGVSALQLLGTQLEQAASLTPLLWLAAPVERVLAVLCHAASRALVLLGVAAPSRFRRGFRLLLVAGGFVLFTLLDAVAGAAHLSGILRQRSAWWIELALLPLAVASLGILVWCRRSFPSGSSIERPPPAMPSPPDSR